MANLAASSRWGTSVVNGCWAWHHLLLVGISAPMYPAFNVGW